MSLHSLILAKITLEIACKLGKIQVCFVKMHIYVAYSRAQCVPIA
jgi:hypothetical protein